MRAVMKKKQITKLAKENRYIEFKPFKGKVNYRCQAKKTCDSAARWVDSEKRLWCDKCSEKRRMFIPFVEMDEETKTALQGIRNIATLALLPK